MRFFILLLLLLIVPQRACGLQSNDTAAFACTEKIKVTHQLTGTGPWLHRQGSTEPISQNQPNPASLYTIIYFYVARTGPVSLKLYNSMGKFVGYFVDGPLVGGETYRVFFPVGILAAGEYFYRFSTAEFTIVKKMVIVK